MKIVSWNCNNGLTYHKVQMLEKFSSDADLYFIQEICIAKTALPKDCNGCCLTDCCPVTDCSNPKELKKCFNNIRCRDIYPPISYGNGSTRRLAVFSNGCNVKRLKDNDGMPFRYVIPYEISKGDEKFVAFHVWIKDKHYENNKAEDYEYSYKYNSKSAILKACDEFSDLFERQKVIMVGDFNFGARLDKDSHLWTHIHNNGEYYFDDCCIAVRGVNIISQKIDSEVLIQSGDHRPILIEF